ncbi:MAG: AAA family ATPase [Prevotella sp.]|nr:AAA family ATPase [Prevotella sp.]
MADKRYDIGEIDLDNQELQQALQIINYTRRSLFLTGKAGSGKSTLLKYICNTTKKKYVVLAPTGIAAINVGGVTLHSFFKIPFHPLLPNDSRFSFRHIKETLKYNNEKRKLLRELDLIIIDEISMVRADIIDFIDKVLRIYNRNMREPFGGKQLLLVGDLYQLEPVVKEEDRKLLQPFYPTNYFFDAHVFREFQLVSIELKKVYRQKDPVFITILDHVRTNNVSALDLQMLNKRVDHTSLQEDNQLAITLSSRRDTVDYINTQELDKLPGDPTLFNGVITGEFPESNLPTPIELYIKPGAQVIFIKNDMDKRWVNGTLGVVEAIDEELSVIYVITEDGEEYEVEPAQWSNIRYTFNEKEQKIEEEEIGIYKQFPIRLAWAITIHKSQGLTFRHVNIDLTGGVFAGGQTYVALSRCVALEGLSLSEPIRREDVFVRAEVIKHAQQYNNQQFIHQALSEGKADKEYHDAIKAFEKGDYEQFLNHFFIAIHSRYDIEKPAAKRLIRKKLSVINRLKKEKEELEKEIEQQKDYLEQLSVEYILMGKECEHEKMWDAAIANYNKALKLRPDSVEAKRRLKILRKKKGE